MIRKVLLLGLATIALLGFGILLAARAVGSKPRIRTRSTEAEQAPTERHLSSLGWPRAIPSRTEPRGALGGAPVTPVANPTQDANEVNRARRQDLTLSFRSSGRTSEAWSGHAESVLTLWKKILLPEGAATAEILSFDCYKRGCVGVIRFSDFGATMQFINDSRFRSDWEFPIEVTGPEVMPDRTVINAWFFFRPDDQHRGGER